MRFDGYALVRLYIIRSGVGHPVVMPLSPYRLVLKYIFIDFYCCVVVSLLLRHWMSVG